MEAAVLKHALLPLNLLLRSAEKRNGLAQTCDCRRMARVLCLKQHPAFTIRWQPCKQKMKHAHFAGGVLTFFLYRREQLAHYECSSLVSKLFHKPLELLCDVSLCTTLGIAKVTVIKLSSKQSSFSSCWSLSLSPWRGGSDHPALSTLIIQ